MHDETALFPDARIAVRWALSDDRAAPQQVSTYRGPGAGKGLSGFDGAAQAGIILSHVRRLGEPKSLFLIAQGASPKLACACRRDCCSGWRSNPTWTEAVNGATRWYIETFDPKCQRPRLVMGCLRRAFGEHITLETIGKRNGASKALACEANGIILKVVKPLLEAGWGQVGDSLAEAGIVEGSASKQAA